MVGDSSGGWCTRMQEARAILEISTGWNRCRPEAQSPDLNLDVKPDLREGKRLRSPGSCCMEPYSEEG